MVQLCKLLIQFTRDIEKLDDTVVSISFITMELALSRLRTKLVFRLWVIIILTFGTLTGVGVWPYKGHLTGIRVSSALAASKIFTSRKFTNSFDLGNCTFSSRGSNRYFILMPSYQSVFTGVDEGKDVKLTITVGKMLVSTGPDVISCKLVC